MKITPMTPIAIPALELVERPLLEVVGGVFAGDEVGDVVEVEPGGPREW